MPVNELNCHPIKCSYSITNTVKTRKSNKTPIRGSMLRLLPCQGPMILIIVRTSYSMSFLKTALGATWRKENIHCVRIKSSTQQKVSQLVQNCKYLPEIINSTTVTIFTLDPKAVLKYS